MRTRACRALAALLMGIGFVGAAHAQVTISQVYGGGGNSGATYTNDFIELHNNGTSAVSVSGWSVQYASSTGSSWQVTQLNGSIAPGGYYLVQESQGTGGTTPLPTPDATGNIAMSGTAGKVALSQATTALTGTCPTGNVDFVGFGSAANCAEGSNPTPTLSNTTAALRNGNGCTDTDNNGNDFTVGAPTPRNSASAPNVCGGGGQPVLSVADVSQAEGNSGTTAFVFTLTLSQPAGADGVTFNVATSDGTATAGSDYVALSASREIPAGDMSTTVTVLVNGDTANEPNETFHLDVTAVTGALPASLQATGTIVNDDFNLVPIHDIQGAGDSSPLVGQVVATSGIVTGVKSNGFFLQTPDAEADANPLTSEGVFVFTSAAPPSDAAVGNRVNVQGTVQEYVPSADPMQPPMTEIGSPSVILVSTGNALPAPVALTTTFPDPDGAYDQLERVESMRVTAASLTVNTPTLGSVTETSATASSNGVFHAVVTGLPRAYRTQGVQDPDTLPAGSPANVPRWNTSPQVMAVGSAALGGARVDVTSGCTIVDGTATGPMEYTFRRYQIDPEAPLSVDCSAADLPRAAQAPGADDVSIATYNMERFFDTTNDPAVDEVVLTDAAFQGRLNKASLGIRNFLHTPDIVTVEEMENLPTLQSLADKINTDAVTASQPNPQYVPYLIEGNDVGGIDIGFLVKSAEVAAGTPRVEVVSVTQVGKATTWTEPGGGSSLLNDRPPLVLQAIVHFADGRSFPITAIGVHQRSLNGAEEDSATGERVRAKRQAQAEFLANYIQQRQTDDPSERIVVLGDFNAFEFNDGYVDPMGTTTGKPSPDDTTVVAGDGADLVNPDLDDLTFLDTPDVSYSYGYDGNVQSLDHVLADQALMNAADVHTLSVSHARINSDFPETARNDFTTANRLSDHDPALLLLQLAPLASADLSVVASATPSSIDAGDTAHFSATVANAGPTPAEFAAVAFVFNASVTPTVTAPAGWTCDAPQAGSGTTTVTCTDPSLAAGASQAFDLAVPTQSTQGGTTLQLAAAVSSQTPDPNAGNNDASAQVTINAVQLPTTDLVLTITGSAKASASIAKLPYVFKLANRGSNPAAAPTLTITGNTLDKPATVVAPAGWHCTQQVASASIACDSAAALAVGKTVSFTVQVAAKPTPAGGVVTVSGSAASATPDASPANNTATFGTTVH